MKRRSKLHQLRAALLITASNSAGSAGHYIARKRGVHDSDGGDEKEKAKSGAIHGVNGATLAQIPHTAQHSGELW